MSDIEALLRLNSFLECYLDELENMAVSSEMYDMVRKEVFDFFDWITERLDDWMEAEG